MQKKNKGLRSKRNLLMTLRYGEKERMQRVQWVLISLFLIISETLNPASSIKIVKKIKFSGNFKDLIDFIKWLMNQAAAV